MDCSKENVFFHGFILIVVVVIVVSAMVFV